MNTEQNSQPTQDKTIILEDLSDAELLMIADECQNETFDDGSLIRILAKQFFGGDSLVQIMAVSAKVLPVVAQRMKKYANLQK